VLNTHHLDHQWQSILKTQELLPYYQNLSSLLQAEASTQDVFPPQSLIFSALEQTPLENVRVVILGQDPYHKPGQAHGLAFSVNHGVKVPPSLKNIHKELHADLGITPPDHGNLLGWARQGVLLLNSSLTVRKGEAGSHAKLGWQILTDALIGAVSREREGVVFLLWGSNAHSKEALIDTDRHCVLKAVHPSPLSAYRGFFGCGHFRQTNNYLQKQGHHTIAWEQFS
jgi:uracil-DNA glycosylase